MGTRKSRNKAVCSVSVGSRHDIISNLMLADTDVDLTDNERCSLLSRFYGQRIEPHELSEVTALIAALVNGDNLNYNVRVESNGEIIVIGIAMLVQKYPKVAEGVMKLNELSFRNKVMAAKNEAMDLIMDGRLEDLSADKLARAVKDITSAEGESKKAGTPNITLNIIGNVSSEEKRVHLNQFFATNPLAAKQLMSVKQSVNKEEVIDGIIEDAHVVDTGSRD